jgi:uncharacterized RDD family membrane protein YckC
VGFVLLPFVTPVSPLSSGPQSSPSLYVMSPGARVLSAAATIALSAAYCVGLWSGGRRTLAMKTWRIAMATAGRAPVSLPRALLRYLACWIGPALSIAAFVALQPLGHGRWALIALAIDYAWALVDPDRRFLQDRVAGTRLVPESK